MTPIECDDIKHRLANLPADARERLSETFNALIGANGGRWPVPDCDPTLDAAMRLALEREERSA